MVYNDENVIKSMVIYIYINYFIYISSAYLLIEKNSIYQSNSTNIVITIL